MSGTVGPYRIMPVRVRAAYDYLSYTLSVEHGCGEVTFARSLERQERAVKSAALRCLGHYLTGEQDFADVLHYAHPVPAELLNGEILECRETEGPDDQVAMETGEDDA
jgi:hypothetical protein